MVLIIIGNSQHFIESFSAIVLFILSITPFWYGILYTVKCIMISYYSHNFVNCNFIYSLLLSDLRYLIFLPSFLLQLSTLMSHVLQQLIRKWLFAGLIWPVRNGNLEPGNHLRLFKATWYNISKS
jgi:hypothetical protein